MQVIARREAKEQGLTRYFTGKPCSNGHVSERYTSAGQCVICVTERGKKWFSDNREKALNTRKDYYNRTYQDRKATIAESNRLWRENNPGHSNALTSEYRAAKLRRTPPWANREAIVLFYENCPKGHQVDHVVPLRGELVSGLHVHYNLQYLPAADNLSKVNKWDPMTDSERFDVH